jgi:hypothetical protein
MFKKKKQPEEIKEEDKGPLENWKIIVTDDSNLIIVEETFTIFEKFLENSIQTISNNMAMGKDTPWCLLSDDNPSRKIIIRIPAYAHSIEFTKIEESKE